MKLALYEPEIAQNTGTLMRLSACVGIELHIILPCGFAFSDKKMHRASMDYRDMAVLVFHDSWLDFYKAMSESHRLILVRPDAQNSYVDFIFSSNDCLILGKESSGFPSYVVDMVSLGVRIPMRLGVRSLNVAVAGAMVLSEALRQTDLLPKEV
jgi:tRNA (cytidine/uridine-2'-O-)-methyltransferase